MNALAHIYEVADKWFRRIPAEDWRRLWDAVLKVVADFMAPGGAPDPTPTPAPQPQSAAGDLFGE